MQKAENAGFLANTEQCIGEYMRYSVGRMLDDLNLDRVSRSISNDRIKIIGLENLENALKMKKGAILISGHFFASRLAKKIMAQKGFPILFDPPPDAAGSGDGQVRGAVFAKVLYALSASSDRG